MTSKLTFWPSISVRMPARSTALMCTNTSFDPSVGWMNPNPFCELKNLTVPVAIMALLAFDTPVNPTRDHRAPGKASEFWEMSWRPKSGAYQGRPKTEVAARCLPKGRQRVKLRKQSGSALQLALLGNALV